MKKEPQTFWEKFEQFCKKHARLLVMALIIIFICIWFSQAGSERELKDNEFIKAAREGTIKKATVELRDNSYEIKGEFLGARNPDDSFTEGGKFSILVPKDIEFEKDQKLWDFLRKYSIEFTVKERSRSAFLPLIFNFLPLIIFVIIFLNIMKGQMGAGKVDKFTSAKTRQAIGPKVTFQDVAGLKEAKEELKEIIDFLKDPTRFSKLGGRVPRGVIIVGPPGSGKTLLARAVAGEADAGFFSMSGSEFVELFVGVGASRVRSLFDQAKKNPPAIIFIDELDALGRQRGAGLGGGHDEREQTLNQLLVELDGFDQRTGIILIAATNRPDILDSALLRPGRFDRKVVTNLPDIEDRIAILKVHTQNKPLAENVDLRIIARGTPMFSGADLENLVNEAALRGAREGKDKIEMEDIEWAKDKVLMGTARKMIITKKEKRAIAYHEVGHALVGLFCPKADPLHKVSIIPRGQTLGTTLQLPLKDKHLYSKQYLKTKLTVLMGGRVAEKIFLNQLSTGASNDIEVATGIARKMVCEWGMSDLGPRSFGRKEGEIFLGREFARTPDYSEETAKKIDEEIQKLVEEGHQKAQKILEKNKDKVKKLVELLLEKETLDGEEVKKLIKSKAAQ